MIAPRPRAILFDLFHTLVAVPPPGGDMGLSIAEALGMPERRAEVARRYYEDDVLDRCRGRVRDPHEMMRAVARGLDPAVADSAIALAVEHRRRRIDHGLIGVEPAFLSALDRLRAAGIATALVSDAGFDDIEAWHQSPLASRLDVTVFSCEVGVRKPDPSIYRCALEQVGVDARHALFVGDGGSDEHRGARAVGMRAVFVTRLLRQWWPEVIENRRAHADFVFEDVAAFVDALLE
jgi:putative hydrolase of the HAD superfamily